MNECLTLGLLSDAAWQFLKMVLVLVVSSCVLLLLARGFIGAVEDYLYYKKREPPIFSKLLAGDWNDDATDVR